MSDREQSASAGLRERIRALVREEFGDEYYRFHVAVVERHACALAQAVGADLEVVSLAALLHDIGRVRHPARQDDHHMTGSEEARLILEAEGCAPETVRRVRGCIERHRGSAGDLPENLEESVVANADAMAHFDVIPWLLGVRLAKGRGVAEASRWLRAKLDRDWERKLTLPAAREATEANYRAATLLLDALLEVDSRP